VKPVLLVPDEGAVEEFVAAGLHPPFQDGVHPWHLEDDLDSRIVEDGVEQVGEFAVAVPDQESRPTAGVLEVNGQVLRRVRYPGCGGVRGGAQDVDSPGGVLDDREYVQAGSGQGDGFDEVAGEEGVGWGAEEVGPGTGRALGRWVDPGLCEDLPDGGGGDLDPEDYAAAVNVIEAERLWLGAPGAALRASDLPPIAVAWVAASRWETW
jgi:hypothetical protein